MVFFIGFLNIVLGLVAELFKPVFLQQLGFGFGSVVFGIFFLLLGFFVKQKSMLALGVAVGLFILDGVLFVIIPPMQGNRAAVGGIIGRFFLLMPMLQGFGTLRALKQETRCN